MLAVAFGARGNIPGRFASVGQVGRASDQAEGLHRRSAPPPGSISSCLDGAPTTEGFITTPLWGNPNIFRFVFEAPWLPFRVPPAPDEKFFRMISKNFDSHDFET